MEDGSRRYVALLPKPELAWPERFAWELRACDWRICAEWAGVEDDDEARALLAPFVHAAAILEGASARVDLGPGGTVHVTALAPAELVALHPVAAAYPHGLALDVRDGAGVALAIACQAVQGIAIGLAGPRGCIRIPDGRWWDSARGVWC